MSLIVAIQVPTGVVLSGDSRTTLTLQSAPMSSAGQPHTVQNVVLSDAAHKVFKVFGRFGIGTYGGAIVNNLPIAHYVEQFELSHQQNQPTSTTATAAALLQYFRALHPIPGTQFIVVGYDADPHILVIDVLANTSTRVLYDAQTSTVHFGAQWGGDIDIVNRLFSNQAHNPQWPLLNLQDAADLSRHLIRATIDQLRFEPRYASVGGPIDTLIVSPRSCEFLIRKDLEAR